MVTIWFPSPFKFICLMFPVVGIKSSVVVCVPCNSKSKFPEIVPEDKSHSLPEVFTSVIL